MFVVALLFGCTDPADKPDPAVPQTAIGPVGGGEMDWTLILGEDDKLSDPSDLGFDADGNLWVSNRMDDRTFIVTDPGTDDQAVDRRKDAAANHFMEEAAALSFDDGTQFGSCGETRNTYDDQYPPNDFMGPVLWTTDLDIFAEENPYGLGSHLDMLHQSPNCVGIAWETANVYWVFDGKNDSIVRYDFAVDHDVGQDDHSDGVVRRVADLEVARVENVPGHMVLDHETGLLYVADTGNGRVLWLDTASGEVGDALRARNEPLAEYSELVDVEWGVLVEDIEEPGGIAMDDTYIYVADHATGVLTAYTRDGEWATELDSELGQSAIRGVEIGPDGQMWVTDAVTPAVWRLDPR